MVRNRPLIKRARPKLWNHAAKPETKDRALREPIKGQGLNSTR
jgi:hypothetical protein